MTTILEGFFDQWVIESFRAQLAALPETAEPILGEREQLAPGVWVVRNRQWRSAGVLDGNADIPLNLFEIEPKALIPLVPWHLDAACRGREWHEFFGEDHVVKQPSLHPTVLRAAREVCSGCAVQHECFVWALEYRESHGIWAGTSGRQRAKMFDELEGLSLSAQHAAIERMAKAWLPTKS